MFMYTTAKTGGEPRWDDCTTMEIARAQERHEWEDITIAIAQDSDSAAAQ